jgi:hypothetical protein
MRNEIFIYALLAIALLNLAIRSVRTEPKASLNDVRGFLVIHVYIQDMLESLGMSGRPTSIDAVMERVLGGTDQEVIPDLRLMRHVPMLLFITNEMLRFHSAIMDKVYHYISEVDMTLHDSWDDIVKFIFHEANDEVDDFWTFFVSQADRHIVCAVCSALSALRDEFNRFNFNAEEVVAAVFNARNWRLVPRYTRPWEILLMEKSGDNRPDLAPYWRYIQPDSTEDHQNHPQTSYNTRQVVWVDAAEQSERMSVRSFVERLSAEGLNPLHNNIKLVIPAEIAALEGDALDLDLMQDGNGLSLDFWYITADDSAIAEVITKAHRIHHELGGMNGARRLHLETGDDEPSLWFVSHDHIEIRLGDAAFLDAGGQS